MRTLHFEYTTGCNSRCVMCNYWKETSPMVLKNETVTEAVSSLVSYGLKTVYFTGGECLLYADNLFAVCKELVAIYPDLKLCLITNGILIEKYYQEIGSVFSKVIISLDTVDQEKYKTVRGVDALPVIQQGIRKLRLCFPAVRVNLRMLVTETTAEDIPHVIEYAIKERLYHVSFLPEDYNSTVAFGRKGFVKSEFSMNTKCIDKLKNIATILEERYLSEFGRLLPFGCGDIEYICSVYEGTNTCLRKCNKASESCVISADGRVNPCFFIQGDQFLGRRKTLPEILSSESYQKIVSEIIHNKHQNCFMCACPKELL